MDRSPGTVGDSSQIVAEFASTDEQLRRGLPGAVGWQYGVYTSDAMHGPPFDNRITKRLLPSGRLRISGGNTLVLIQDRRGLHEPGGYRTKPIR